MRPPSLVLVSLSAASLFVGGAAMAQQSEAPSSKPLPSPGAPPPPTSAPGEGATAVAAARGPDRDAAREAVRVQCAADRARFCREAADARAGACLTAAFSRLTPDCQSAVNALKEAHRDDEVVVPR